MSVSVFAGYHEPEDFETEDFRPDSPPLTRIPYTLPEPEPEPERRLYRSPSPARRHYCVDPAEAIVLRHLAPNYPELARIDPNPLDSPLGASSRRCSDMSSNQYHGGDGVVGVSCVKPELPSLADIYPAAHTPRRISGSRHFDGGAVDARMLEAKAAAAFRESEARIAEFTSSIDEGGVRPRVDSAQEQVERKPPPGRRRSSPAPHSTALRLKTTLPAPQGLVDTLSDPLSRHAISQPRVSVGSFPSLQHSPPVRDVQHDSVSPATNRLPSIRQLTSTVPLEQLAEVATHQEHVQPSLGRHHSYSIGSAGSPTSYFPYSIGIHGSPTNPANYARNPRSPANSISEPHPIYGSPSFPCPSAAYYHAHRRSSSTADRAPSGPPSVPSLPSASSTGSIHTQGSSSADGGYSTHHTTPLNSTPLPDGLQRTLPPHPGVILPSFRCDWPGCTAPPFSTQYLLSSHRNVHSQNRPYYCSVPGCARSEGGKGFKRKNEMIRHGLVHESPGYRCPFCPDREHRYPRPDNLLRHVNVHHTDRERNDPRLTAILAQRREGAGKARRRRTTGSGAGLDGPTAAAAAFAIGGDGKAVTEGDDYGDDGDERAVDDEGSAQTEYFRPRTDSPDLGSGGDYAADEADHAESEGDVSSTSRRRRGHRIWDDVPADVGCGESSISAGGGGNDAGIGHAFGGDGPALSHPLGLS